MDDKQYLFGTPAMFNEMEKKVLIIVRDGRQFVGILKSLDQFGNIALDDTFERFCLADCYSDIHIGAFVVRGENVVFIGVYNEELNDMPDWMEPVTYNEFSRREEKLPDNLKPEWRPLDTEPF